MQIRRLAAASTRQFDRRPYTAWTRRLNDPQSLTPLPTAMLSIVIPVFNEAESLATLHQELSEVAAAQGYDLDVVFVDDGSTDGSWKAIRRLAERRSARQRAAVSPQLRQGRRPERRLRPGPRRTGDDARRRSAGRSARNSQVSWPRWRRTSTSSAAGKKCGTIRWQKVLPSRVFNWMVSRVTGVKLHDHNCGMKCYRREMFDEVRLYGELHRFVPVLAAGARVSRRRGRHQPSPAAARPLEIRTDPLSSRVFWT